ncbi:MAG: hypothetical protein M1815_002041 [Lichina confinis]|nr:MAG: hypothetical protein M1815_002041 [Lichina confinis]
MPALCHHQAQQIRAKFELGVSIAMFSWPALSIAVDNGWAGPDSKEKREWFVGVVCDMFTEKADIEVDDVQEMLLDVMDQEFQVVLEDDSDYDVAQRIMQLRDSTFQGDFAFVDQVHAAWEKRKGNTVVAVNMHKGVDVEDSGDDDDDDQEEEDDDDDDVGMQDAPPVSASRGRQKQEPEVDDDGFTKVISRRR